MTTGGTTGFTHTHTHTHTETPYHLWYIPDMEGYLDQAPVGPGAGLLADVIVGVPQANQHLGGHGKRGP